jgi:hypothetical protein
MVRSVHYHRPCGPPLVSLMFALGFIGVIVTGVIFLELGSREAAFQAAHPFYPGYRPRPFHTGILAWIPAVAAVEACVSCLVATYIPKATHTVGTVLAAISLALSVILWDNAWRIEGQVRYCFGSESCAAHLGTSQMELAIAKYLLTLSLAVSIATFLWFASHLSVPSRSESATVPK